MDLSTRLGAGALQLNGGWDALVGLIGEGVTFCTGLPWLAIPSLQLSTGRSFDVDVSFSLGACFFLPWRSSAFERR